ncbi:hypothetical protein [Duganella violaceipulchra]|uniref:Uncharacterized protein n=1 Tax=Duganella violaceipulchra TaxID=2849652 RepID=A0AA41L855_9BURK|nr:hypothetical protein [Duganella violaceicalia]MBV6321895.1 hypothetical protein [Duganella violaceicalia]MCP2007111.1 hypothetical protein [Duganella violaceicalia]
MPVESDFRIIRPLSMTDALLSSSTVPEIKEVEWSSGSTYGLGDVRGVSGANNSQQVYQSLAAANTNHAPASSPAWWKPMGLVYGTYSSGATYALGDIVTVITANSHLLYQSVIAANVGNPVSDVTKWTVVGATNRWLMFDKSVQSQTVAPRSITQVITPGALVNTITLLNITGASATVSQAVSGYSKTKRLLSHDVLNWYDWYYEDLTQLTDVVFDDVPPYPDSALTITVDNGTVDAGLGCCFIGKSRTIGSTQWELTGGVLSYSTSKEELGVITMVKRANAKRLNFEVRINLGFEDEAYRLLTQYTDVEIVIIATSSYAMGLAYGFLGQWSVPISNSGKTAPIEFRALT